MNMNGLKPRYNHDCNHCVFLGRYKKFDLYVCVGSERTGKKFDDTIIARYGVDGDYYSGMAFRDKIEPLRKAFKRACDKGIIKKEDY